MKMEKKKILLIGDDDLSKSELMLATLKEKYGEDVIIVTRQQAKEQGLKMTDFYNLPTMKITAPLINPHPPFVKKSGKENRRARRKNERKNKF